VPTTISRNPSAAANSSPASASSSAAHRRPAGGNSVTPSATSKSISPSARVTRAGADLHVTVKEYALLRLLLQHRGKVVTHRQILRDVWGAGHENDTHYLRVHMVALRKKIEPSPQHPRFLKTESGVGYRLTDD
jgi:two-component system KDP operon response regulator KdpE